MNINWQLILVLFCLCIPGTVIATKRLIYFLLPNNSEKLKKRISRFAILQTLVMVLLMCCAGTIISKNTGLNAPILEALLEGKAGISTLIPIIFPTMLYSLLGLIVFCVFYYSLANRCIDKKSLHIMAKLRIALGIDGCILYGGIVEEIIARWGLLNLAVFFALIFTKQPSTLIIWLSIFISGILFAVGQLPAYIAAGCTSNRSFIYSFIFLSLYQSVFFGYLFWQYGLICSVLAHMLFHLGWALYDRTLDHPIQNSL
ncbi:CPBP family intramembrane glutamate endopeptidase [Legionella sp.]|uniref:CPBP family intramembrane glutamate endopeptidase n=1 Tax=Legionella sp. TaxID=459 RepID=UPI003C816624